MPKIEKDYCHGISVIICAKNEHDNLRLNLPLILQQDYPKDLCEFIVVNDGSTDGSENLLNELMYVFPQLRIVTIPNSETRMLPGKKWALDQGIQKARFENVLLTDADCYPTSNQWMKEFSRCKTETQKQIILGYGKYEQQRGFLNAFIRWETFHTAIPYFSFAKIGKAYMGVGRNLFYEKQLYLKAKANANFWDNYKKTPSGDDDLLISEMSTEKNTGVCFHKNAQTISSPANTWKSWWVQKSRHVSTGKYYSKNIQFFLSLYALSHALFWLLGISLMFLSLVYGNFFILKLVLFLFIWRTGLYLSMYNKWQKLLAEKSLLSFALIGDLGWSIYHVVLSPYIFWKNKNKWK